VRGELETRKLSPGTRYEVAFVIMMKEAATGWEAPVNVRLILPDGNKQERKENLMKKPRGMDRDHSRRVCSITRKVRRDEIFNLRTWRALEERPCRQRHCNSPQVLGSTVLGDVFLWL
jgi:hypothetical protein